MKSGRRPADKPLINRLSTAYSEEMFKTVVFDALEGTRDGCVLREQTCRRPILPGPPRPAALPCAARPDPPVVCPGFGFDKLGAGTLVSNQER